MFEMSDNQACSKAGPATDADIFKLNHYPLSMLHP